MNAFRIDTFIYWISALLIIGILFCVSYFKLNAIWLLPILFVVIAAAVLSNMIARRGKHSFFGNRASLTMDAIYERYYSDSSLPRHVVTTLWREIAEMLNLPKGKMRPTDRLDKELGPYRFVDDDIDGLEGYISNLLRKTGMSLDYSSLKTLDDLIMKIGPIYIEADKSDAPGSAVRP